jgi:hypothetical protein
MEIGSLANYILFSVGSATNVVLELLGLSFIGDLWSLRILESGSKVNKNEWNVLEFQLLY